MFTRPVWRTTVSACTRRYVSNGHEGPNDAIIELLKKNMQEEDTSAARNSYKVRAFATAINAISRLDHPIRSAEEASSIKGVGVGITKRIQAFLSGTEYLPSPEDRDPALLHALSTLRLVHGIGPTMAKKLVDAGCMSISDLHKQKYNAMLKPTMKIGLKYINHMGEPVTRQQAETALEFIRENISTKFDILLTGSFRRGATTSSDIDIVLFHPSYVHVPTPSLPDIPKPPSPTRGSGRSSIPFRTKYSSAEERSTSLLIHDVVKVLEDRGFLAASLSSGPRKWQGIVRLPERTVDGAWEDKSHRQKQIQHTEGMYRRMDLNLVPLKSRGAALLALTGDAEFVRHIRGKAISLGMHLNEFGLWRWQANGASKDTPPKDGYWELVRAESEEQILRELGMEYVEAGKRNFGFVVGRKAERRGGKSNGGV